MTCASCAARVEKRLNRLEGVGGVGQLRHRDGLGRRSTRRASPPRAWWRRSSRPGYRRAPARRPRSAGPSAAGRRRRRPRAPTLRRRLVVSAVLTVPVLLLSMIPALQFDNWQWLALQLATPVVLWGGVALPPRGLGQPAPRRGDHGHADLARRRSPPGAGRWWPCSCSGRATRTCGWAFDLRDRSGRRRRPHLPRGGRRRHHLPAGRAATSRRAPSAARARRCGRCSSWAPRRRRCSTPTAPSAGCRSSELRRGRPLRGAPRRAHRHRRRRGGGPLGGRRVAADGRERPRRGRPRRRGRRGDDQRRRPPGGARHPRRARTPRSRRSGGW